MVEQSVQRRDISSNLSKEWKKSELFWNNEIQKRSNLKDASFNIRRRRSRGLAERFSIFRAAPFKLRPFWKENFQGLQSKGMPARQRALRFETKTLSWLIQKNDKWTITMSYVQSNTVRDFNISTVPEFQAHLLSHNQLKETNARW